MKQIVGLLVISVMFGGCLKKCYECKTSWSVKLDNKQNSVISQKSIATEEFCSKDDTGVEVASHEQENSFEYVSEEGEYIIQSMRCINSN